MTNNAISGIQVILREEASEDFCLHWSPGDCRVTHGITGGGGDQYQDFLLLLLLFLGGGGGLL